MLKGITASPGYAIGKILKIDPQFVDTSKIIIKNIKHEIAYFHEAIEKTILQLNELKNLNGNKFNEETLSIFDSHIAIAQDPEVIKMIEDKITNESCNLAYAVESVISSIVSLFENIADDYMRQRASDLLEVSDRIIKNHLNIQMIDLQNISEKVILASQEISASEAAQINPKYVLGIISETGGKIHTAQLLRVYSISQH